MNFGKHIFCSLFFTFILFLVAGFTNAQVCHGNYVSVHYWKPSKGNIPEYTANIVRKNKNHGFIIILGKTTNGVYTIEGQMHDDATGGISANLVFTDYDGVQTNNALYGSDTLRAYWETDSMRIVAKDLTIKKLKQFQKEKILVGGELHPTYYSVIDNPGEFETRVEIKIPGKSKKLVWSFAGSSEMCWCFYGWGCYVAELKTK
jgi:hypothetical protein